MRLMDMGRPCAGAKTRPMSGESSPLSASVSEQTFAREGDVEGQMGSVRVLGVDPGVATTGYGIVERSRGRLRALQLGVLTTSADLPQQARLACLSRALEDLLGTHGVDSAAVERLFFNANARTAMSVGQASGVVLAALGKVGLEVAEYTPLEVKQSVVGFGGAPKRQVQAMVAALLGLERQPAPADVADACALAICHINRSGLAAAVVRHRSAESAAPVLEALNGREGDSSS